MTNRTMIPSKALPLWVWVATMGMASCYAGTASETSADPSGRGPSIGRNQPIDGDAGSGASGLPCEVDAVLTRHCASCHGVSGSQAPRLATYADLATESSAHPGVTEAERSIVRMRSSQSPMPPSGGLTDAEIRALESWVSAGMPAGSCATQAGDAGPTAPVESPYDTPLTCTSKKTYSRGNGTYMHPGKPCISCHTSEREGPIYTFAGTVYPTAHEPDDCNGSPGDSTIVVTDAKGIEARATANAQGNFYYTSRSTKLTFPLSVKVVRAGKERVMSAKVQNGDCNTCHTASGTDGAPGRIMAP